MQCATACADDIIIAAVDAVRRGAPAMESVLDELPAPIYTTDAEGRITFFNRACINFAGRTPVIGEDRWCVTWKLYNQDGTRLPHANCPMAVAIAEKRPVRGVEAIAERPDGTRVNFRPYPTPLLDDQGEVVGAVNMLIDVTSRKQAERLAAEARRCRRLAQGINDPRTINTLKLMADEYEGKARALDLTH